MRDENLEEIYKPGWPKAQGWFDCLYKGEEMRMRHWICILSNRHEWIKEDGSYISDKESVRWYGEAGLRP